MFVCMQSALNSGPAAEKRGVVPMLIRRPAANDRHESSVRHQGGADEASGRGQGAPTHVPALKWGLGETNRVLQHTSPHYTKW